MALFTFPFYTILRTQLAEGASTINLGSFTGAWDAVVCEAAVNREDDFRTCLSVSAADVFAEGLFSEWPVSKAVCLGKP